MKLIHKISDFFGLEQFFTIIFFLVCSLLYLPVVLVMDSVAITYFHKFQYQRAMDGAEMANFLIDYIDSFEPLRRMSIQEVYNEMVLPIDKPNVKITDEYYQKIGVRWTARYVDDPYASQLAQKILDIYGTKQCVSWALMINKNGYAPWHMTKYSKTLTGDLKTDQISSRHKRIWSDWVEKINNSKENTPIEYIRQPQGELQYVVAAPMKLLDKHWGYFMIGYTPEQIAEVVPNYKTLAIIVCFITALIAKFVITVSMRKYNRRRN